jgi:hypothetical protein
MEYLSEITIKRKMTDESTDEQTFPDYEEAINFLNACWEKEIEDNHQNNLKENKL